MQESYANVAFRIPADLLGVSITDVKGAWAGNDQEPVRAPQGFVGPEIRVPLG